MKTKPYKNYIGSYRKIDNIYYGKVEEISDLVTFQTDSIICIQKEFEDAIDDYFKFCQEVEKFPQMTKEKMEEFYKKILGPPKEIFNEEDSMKFLEILHPLTPFKETNNQQTETSYYMYKGTEYQVHYGIEDYPVVYKILKE